MAIRKKHLSLDSVDSTRLLLDNNSAIRSKNASGADIEVLKVDAENVLRLVTPDSDISIKAGDGESQGNIVLDSASVVTKNSILPESTGSSSNPVNLGSTSKRFYQLIWANALSSGNGSIFNSATVPSGTTSVFSVVTSSGGSASGVGLHTASGSQNTKSVFIESGNSTGATTNSGDINIQTGSATGTRGKILLNASQIDINSDILPSSGVTARIGSNSLPIQSAHLRSINVIPAATVYSSNGKSYSSSNAAGQLLGYWGAAPDGLASPGVQSFADFAIGTENISSGSADSNKVRLLTGNTVDGDSGEILIRTGMPSGIGTRGNVRVDAAALELSQIQIKGLADAIELDDAVNLKQLNEKVAALVDSAPEVLDTLQELAAALGDDPQFATTVAGQIGELSGRLDELELDPVTETQVDAKDAVVLQAAKDYADAQVGGSGSTIQAQLESLVVPVQHYEQVTLDQAAIDANQISVTHEIVGTPWVMREMLMGILGVHFTFSGNSIQLIGEWAAPEGASKIESGETIQVYYMRNTRPFA